MITTFFGVSSWPSAASSLSDSFTASCTKALVGASPKACSVALAEAAAEALHPRDAQHLLEDVVVAVEDVHADLGQLGADLLDLARAS